MTQIRALTAAAVCLIAAFLAPGCTEKVSDENFEKITLGMGLDQVQGFMGEGEREDRGGTSISGAGIAGGSPNIPTTKTFSWKSGNKQIIVETKDEKVIAKRKVGF
jgi:hypothetical protein